MQPQFGQRLAGAELEIVDDEVAFLRRGGGASCAWAVPTTSSNTPAKRLTIRFIANAPAFPATTLYRHQ